MELSAQMRDQVASVIDILVNNAVRFIESQPLGSYLPMWKLNKALAGCGAHLNIKAISGRMAERGCTRSFYVIKGRNEPVGLLIVSAEAIDAVNRAYAGARLAREDRQRTNDDVTRHTEPQTAPVFSS